MLTERVEFVVAEGREQEFLDYLDSYRAMFGGIAGCLSYRFGRGVEDPSRTLLLVEWESMAAHEAARAPDSFKKFGQGIGPFLAGAPTMVHFDMA
jgi:quinol monooxygenase YgiN